jgi:hypothetical protein
LNERAGEGFGELGELVGAEAKMGDVGEVRKPVKQGFEDVIVAVCIERRA